LFKSGIFFAYPVVNMDKLIPEEELIKRKRKAIYITLACFGLLFFLVFIFRLLVKPSVDRSLITISTVERGAVENTITAAGEVLPEFEQVISSPINSSVREVSTEAGTSVSPGQQIVTLDKSSSVAEYQRQQFQQESRRNSIRKIKLELDKSFFDMKSNNEIKQLRINSLKASLEDYNRLYKAGGATREDVAKAELELKVAELEKKQLENEIRSKQQSMRAEIRESEIAAVIQENELKELGRKLNLADIRASRPGVVTWVNSNIGSAVQEGDVLARIADLKSFKVSGTISDSFLDQLRKGMPAIVRINDSLLAGTVSSVSPGIQNGLISFDVQLKEKNNKLLRPNLKADVYLVTESKSNVLRVSNGPAFKGSGLQEVFVVKGSKAIRRALSTGLANTDYIELQGNVQAGEVLITSDMSDYKHAKEIGIRN